MTENWYVILELEFDPKPVVDESIIEQKIEEKRKFWSSKANDFNHGAEYRRYSQKLPEIKKDMIGDANIRDELIKDACEKVYGPVDKRLKQIGKTEISEDMVDKIAKKDKVSADVVKRRAAALGIKIGENSQGGNYQALYDKYYKTKPQNADKFNGMKQLLNSFNVDNLYDFLSAGISMKNASHLPCDSLRQRAKEKKTKEFYKNDSISGTGSKLCGLCDEAFKDDNSKQVYDKYLEYNKRKTILDGVKELYSITEEISPEQYSESVGKLTELFKDRKLAESVLVAFCKIEKIPVAVSTGAEAKNPNIKICRCGCINDISNGRDTCQNCGRKLQIKCPKCGTANDSNINVCKCGFKFENLDKAMALCELAVDAIENMEFKVAKAHLSDAEKYWPNSEEVAELRKRLSELEGRVGSAVEDMKESCKNKDYFAARKNLESVKKYFPDYSDPDIESEINVAIENAEKYKGIAQSASDENEIVEACTKAYESCNDCPGVKEIIAKYPPMEPTNLIISPDPIAKVNVLSWTASATKGLLYYSIVRKEGAVPISVQDGQLVARVSMTSVNDKDIVPGSQYYYAVFAERAGVYSKALTSKEPVSNLFEISGVAIAAGDGSLQFTWEPIADNAVVGIERIDGGKTVGFTCNNRSSFVDTELVNDREYQYKVYIQYAIGVKKIKTSGVNISGTPTRPPLPIEKLIVKPIQNNDFQIEWENPENVDIQFYYSEIKPVFFSGDVLPLSTLESKMKPLLVQKTSALSGTFSYANEDLIYIVAAVVKSGSAVVGTVARASKGGAVKINDITPVNGKLLISVELPKDATGFVVLYRNDQFPEDISDVKTTRKYIPLKQYEYDSGLLIDANEQQNYYFSVFAEFKRDGEKDYSVGTDRLYSNVSKEVITYSVDVSKKLFGPRTLTLCFQAENRKFLLPDIDIMSSIGVAPMFKKSAKLFYEIEKRKVEGVAEFKVTLAKGMPKDTYIKAFLKDDSLQGRYQLKLKLKSELKIS